MSRIEKRLWLIWLSIFILALASSVALTAARHESFPGSSLARLRRALRPEREARKVEQASSLEGIETLRVRTTATNLVVKRNENMIDLSITLEGQFVKSLKEPLTLKKEAKALTISVEEGLTKRPWNFALDDENRNSALTLVLPRQFSGSLIIETVSGDTSLESLSLGRLDWQSVSGELQSSSGEIHSTRLHTVSGNVSYFGETPDFKFDSTSADATVVLQKIETAVAPKVEAETVSGRIDVSVPEDSSMRISISSFTGEATTSLSLQKSMHSKGAYEGVLGSGGGELRLRSVSGNVRLTTLKKN